MGIKARTTYLTQRENGKVKESHSTDWNCEWKKEKKKISRKMLFFFRRFYNCHNDVLNTHRRGSIFIADYRKSSKTMEA